MAPSTKKKKKYDRAEYDQTRQARKAEQHRAAVRRHYEKNKEKISAEKRVTMRERRAAEKLAKEKRKEARKRKHLFVDPDDPELAWDDIPEDERHLWEKPVENEVDELEDFGDSFAEIKRRVRELDGSEDDARESTSSGGGFIANPARARMAAFSAAFGPVTKCDYCGQTGRIHFPRCIHWTGECPYCFTVGCLGECTGEGRISDQPADYDLPPSDPPSGHESDNSLSNDHESDHSLPAYDSSEEMSPPKFQKKKRKMRL